MKKFPKINVNEYSLLDGFNRGYLADVEAVFDDGVRYLLYFVSSLTIAMYFSSRQVEGGYTVLYTEKNLIIIPEITMVCIEAAIKEMVKQQRFEELCAEES